MDHRSGNQQIRSNQRLLHPGRACNSLPRNARNDRASRTAVLLILSRRRESVAVVLVGTVFAVGLPVTFPTGVYNLTVAAGKTESLIATVAAVVSAITRRIVTNPSAVVAEKTAILIGTVNTVLGSVARRGIRDRCAVRARKGLTSCLVGSVFAVRLQVTSPIVVYDFAVSAGEANGLVTVVTAIIGTITYFGSFD